MLASGAPAAAHLHVSIIVRSAECLDTHYFAVLVGVGATAVNAYLAQESDPDRHRRPVRRRGDAQATSALNYKASIEQGLLKIMSKMGIAVISSYRGGYNFEAVGLSRALVSEFFPGMPSRISGIGLAGHPAQAPSSCTRRAWANPPSPCRSAASTKLSAQGRGRTPSTAS